MDRHRFARAKALYLAIVDLDPRARSDYLLEHASDDDELRTEVQAWLEFDADESSIATESRPTIRVLAEIMAAREGRGCGAPSLAPGERLGGRYRIDGFIDRGPMSTTPTSSPGPVLDPQPPVKNLEFKAGVLLLLLLTLLVGSALYVMNARGVFERTQRLVLMSDDSEGVVTGMDMTFAGFAIGTVSRIELADDGNVRIVVDVPTKDAKWLRSSSIFTMEKALVGGTKIRAYSGVLSDPPLEDGAVRQVLRGDAAAEIPKLVAQVRDLLDNLNGLTREGAPLSQSLANLQATTATLNGPQWRHGHVVWQRGRCEEDRDHH